MRILGLDLSITSPAFCIMDVNEDFTIKEIFLHGFTKTEKWLYQSEHLKIHKIPSNYNSHPSHYRPYIIYNIVKEYMTGIDYMAIEDYAMGAKGKVFDLAEFAGGMKNFFYMQNIPTKKLPPMSVKMCATGKGNADKVIMGMRFKQSIFPQMVDNHIFNLPEAESPSEDLIDAFYMANVLRAELSYLENGKFPSDLGMFIAESMAAIVTGRKGASTKPTIEHPMIGFGSFSRVKKDKKEPKTKKEPAIMVEKKAKPILKVK